MDKLNEQEIRKHIDILNISYHLCLAIIETNGHGSKAIVHSVGYNKNSKLPTLSLNSDNNKYHCVRCGAGGYGTELYAKVKGISKYQAVDELLKKECYSQNKVKIEISPINLLADIKLRDAVYRDFLNMLKLEGQHIGYLRRIGLLDSFIENNLYRTVPKNYIMRSNISADTTNVILTDSFILGNLIKDTLNLPIISFQNISNSYMILNEVEQKKNNFKVMLANILDSNNSELTFDEVSSINLDILEEKGIWIQEDSREYVVNLINALTNKIYKVNENGFLIEDIVSEKSEKEQNSQFEFYTEKIDELLNSNKLIVISINNTYKQLNEIDEDIIDIKMEEDEYALLFKENDNDEESNDIIVLNSDVMVYNYLVT